MDQVLQIDLQKVIQANVSASKRRFIPVGMLKRLIREEDLNRLLRDTYPATGSAFSDGVLQELNINLMVDDHNLNELGSKGLIFVSNHPLGGLDGIALVKVLGERYGDSNVRVIVNNLLMYVSPLREMFVSINKYGKQGKDGVKEINELYASDKNICIFPAGLVSRLHKGGKIKDLEWQKSFVVKALEYGRTVVPVKFEALNSRLFYRIAKLRKQLGIKVNLEQALLPREIFHSRNKEFVIKFCKGISAEELGKMGTNPKEIAAAVKERVYGNNY